MIKKAYLIAVLCILLDQIMKTIIRKYFSFEKNYGIAFGLLQNKLSLLIFIGFLIIGFLVYYSNKVKGLGMLGIGLLLGGASSNLIDRMAYGYIVDFIKIWIWPAFNFADVFNVIGVILLILYFRKL